jgi:hypothetical protein
MKMVWRLLKMTDAMKDVYCPLNPYCHVWDEGPNGVGVRGCTFLGCPAGAVEICRNIFCPMPVEIVLSKLEALEPGTY